MYVVTFSTFRAGKVSSKERKLVIFRFSPGDKYRGSLPDDYSPMDHAEYLANLKDYFHNDHGDDSQQINGIHEPYMFRRNIGRGSQVCSIMAYAVE